MPVHLILALIIGGQTPALEPFRDTLLLPVESAVAATLSDRPDSLRGRPVAVPAGVRRVTGQIVPLPSLSPADTPTTTRRRATEVSSWYGPRLWIHRITAIVIPGLFIYQYSLGDKIIDAETEGRAPPAWVRPAHRTGAKVIAGAFAVNTVTGAWNWWDSRHSEEGRLARTLHALSMVGAMGGFTYAGIKLAEDAQTADSFEEAMDKRRQHRAVALTSMGVTVVSAAAMWLVNR
jgi:hypothetical protein